MHVTEIIPARIAVDPATGRTCSIYGVVPANYTSVEHVGWTFRLSNGAIGLGRPAKTLEEATERANQTNDRRIVDLMNHADFYPYTAARCYQLAAELPRFIIDDNGHAQAVNRATGETIATH